MKVPEIEPTTADEVEEYWRQCAVWFGTFHVPTGEALCRTFLRHLEIVRRGEDDKWVSAAEAVTRSGYSDSQLRRMAREGRVDTTKRGRLWVYRAGSLPRKACRIAPVSAGGYNALVDAAAVAKAHRRDAA